MDSLTLFGYLFKTPCEAICIFLDFFTEKRGSHREIYDFFRKSHETHCICRKFSIYCNKNCSGNMRILCPFAETTYAPSGDENSSLCFYYTLVLKQLTPRQGTKTALCILRRWQVMETTYAPSGDENCKYRAVRIPHLSKQLTPRQGTKTPRNTFRGKHRRKQLTPRQGTKTYLLFMRSPLSFETTYAPSGDENQPVGHSGNKRNRNNLRPVRGRKLR